MKGRRRSGPRKALNYLHRGIRAYHVSGQWDPLESSIFVELSEKDAPDSVTEERVEDNSKIPEVHKEKALSSTSGHGLDDTDLPKRYTLYDNYLLLGPNFSTYSPLWKEFYGSLKDEEKQELFRHVVEHGFKGFNVTHVAINAPIPPETDPYRCQEDGPDAAESSVYLNVGTPRPNVLRSPGGIQPVYGDWSLGDSSKERYRKVHHPSDEDFETAFWTSVAQIEADMTHQCWAPLYTMFSRGNTSEKARIVGNRSSFPGLTDEELGQSLSQVDIVDFYVGIGYFTLCYLARGARRVYGWDINPWSLEGLRRGCEMNGLRSLVVKVDDGGNVTSGGGLQTIAAEIIEGDRGQQGDVIRCVAFLGDNTWAAKILRELDEALLELEAAAGAKSALNVRHANLGLLPSSRSSWEGAISVIFHQGHSHGGWLHVHENVDVQEIDLKATDVVEGIQTLTRGISGTPTIWCAHIEQVKTYAPGVMHCVFDIEFKSNG
jgi:tRNA wybutosine-synthesizing protein 2